MNPEYYQYFKEVATNHKQIGHSDENMHFCEIEMHQLDNEIHTRLEFPALALMSERFSGLNNHSNMRWNVDGGFFILDKVHDRHDYQEVRTVKDRCRKIAEQVAAKMVNDRKRYDVANKQFALPGLNIDSFSIAYLSDEFTPFYGVICTFGYNLPASRFNADDWNNETEYAV